MGAPYFELCSRNYEPPPKNARGQYKLRLAGDAAKGAILVYIRSDNCNVCRTFDSTVLPALVANETRISYGRFTYEKNPDVMRWAAQSTFPYTYYPMILLYVMGEPRFHFSGDFTYQNVLNFIDAALKKLSEGIARPQTQLPNQNRFVPQQQMPVGANQRLAPNNGQGGNMSLQNAFGSSGLKANGVISNSPMVDDDEKYHMKEIEGLIPKNEPWRAH